MIRLLHVADVHLGASYEAFGPLAAERRQEVLDAFRALPQIAEAEGAHAVLVAGDLFDSPRPSDFTLAVVRQVFRRLVDANRPVFVVPGHFDCYPSNPSLFADALGGAVVFRQPTFGEPVSVETAAGVVNVYGCAHDWALAPDPLATFKRRELPGVHVVLLHGAAPGTPHWHRGPTVLRLPLHFLAELPVDWIALGGHHHFRTPFEFDPALRVPACYSGSFAAVDFGEPGPRGYAIVELQPGSPARAILRAARVRPVVELPPLDVSAHEDDEAVAGAIAAQVEDGGLPLVTLIGQLSFPLQVGRLHALLRERLGAAHVVDDTWYADSPRLDALVEQETVAGHVARIGRERVGGSEDRRARFMSERALRLALRALRVQ